MYYQGTPPKLAMINSFAGYGRCSLTVAMPIVSAMGVQACPVPTAILSNHLAFPTCHRTDFTEQMNGYLSCWKELHIGFDGILCGFLGSADQALLLSDFICYQKETTSPMVVVDPIMGDNGRFYSSVSSEYFDAQKKLIAHADIITPNLTESCFLTGTDYPFHIQDDTEHAPAETFLALLAEKLHALGPKKVVITGIPGTDCFYNYVSDRENSCTGDLLMTPSGGESRHGTGDIFTAVLTASLLKQSDLSEAVKKAAEFVRICIEGSAANHIPSKEGVCFENYLSYLIS